MLKEVEVKQGIRRHELPDPFSLGSFRVSPYMGCSHGCVYCDGRAERYHIEGDFERDVIVRTNIGHLVEKELQGVREKGIVSIGSGISDVYQAAESKYRLTRQILEACIKHNFPVRILTKSASILDDLDLLKELARGPGLITSLTITHWNNDVLLKAEPGASSLDERLDAVKKLKAIDAGCGILAMPMLPGIGDSYEDMEKLLALCASCNPDFIAPAYVTLRPGRQKDFYFQFLQKKFPDQIAHTENLFKNELISGRPEKEYRRNYFSQLPKNYWKFPFMTPHELYKGCMYTGDEVFVLLCHMLEIYRLHKQDLKRLKNACNCYSEWWGGRKAVFRKKRSLDSEWLEQEFSFAMETGELEALLQNTKLFNFISSIARGGVFDYVTKKIKDRKNA